MSVELHNYRARNTLYHVQTYFTLLTQQGGSNWDPIIDYPGYISGFDPRIIKQTEWEALTEGAYGPGGTEQHDYQNIQGTITGFTNDSTIWHGPLHMILTDGENYGLGACVVLFSFDGGVGTKQFWVSLYAYDSAQGGYWHYAGSGGAYYKPFSTDYQTIYNTQPEYVYLAMETNSSSSSPRYPYPNSGGAYYQGQEHSIYSSGFGISQYLIPALVRAGNTPEVVPDPQPTPIKNDDPYAPGGNTWTGGGTGNFDNDTDDIGIPNLPTLSASSTGFITLYNPSAAQLRNLANYMWSGLFDLDTYKKIFADPMGAILGLSIVPVNVPSGGSASVMVGNIDTGILMTTASSQYVEVDCGSIDVEEYWGSYLDYDPYTEIQIYLPYIGIHALKSDDVVGRTVTVKYHVDVLSGACIAYVKCGSSVLYSFVGQCASSIPITGSDWTNVINGMINIAGSIGSMVATGGATAPMALGSIASTAVNSMKPSVEKSGSLSGTGGLMGIQTPYLIITRPRQAIPEGQNRFIGYPSFITDFIANLNGYTEITEVHLEGIHATSAELTEIESILKGGVLL